MIEQGFMIMLVGMGTVFVFLGALVGLMNVLAGFFASWPEDSEVNLRVEGLKNKALEQDSLIEIAVALAAIEHKQRSKQTPT
ncbi:MAG: hypothetical protein CMK59_07320 [Proteobacteria bacterium]|nr:hypothetical protein [Pseudomonadota bacterium]